jgi:hypothetical protein
MDDLLVFGGCLGILIISLAAWAILIGIGVIVWLVI